MATRYAQVRARAMRLAAECASLGAGVRPIICITGLSRPTVLRHWFSGDRRPPRGRPPTSSDWYFEASIDAQVESCVFAARFVELRQEGFDCAECLLCAYRRYSTLHGQQAQVSFDRAFEIAGQIEGVWTAKGRTLAVLPCRHCECLHLVEAGSTGSEPCPFCRAVARVQLGGPERPAALPAPPPAVVLPHDLYALERAQACARLGARIRTVALLSGLPVFEVRRLFFFGHAGADPGGGRYRSAGWIQRARHWDYVRASALAAQVLRLERAGFAAEDALIAGYEHHRGCVAPHDAFTFDRAFDLLAQLTGRWSTTERTLYLSPCRACACERLRDIATRVPVDCPFCRLLDCYR